MWNKMQVRPLYICKEVRERSPGVFSAWKIYSPRSLDI